MIKANEVLVKVLFVNAFFVKIYGSKFDVSIWGKHLFTLLC